MIRATHLGHKYRRGFELKDVSFEIAQGAFAGIIGPNGSGKSTLLRLMLRSLATKPGMLFVDGHDVASLHPKKLARTVSYVPQMSVTDQAFTVRELIAMGRFPHRRRFAAYDSSDPVVDSVIESMKLEAFAERSATGLSGGELQRVLVGRALAQSTPVILLDEPTNHLDLRHQLSLLALLQSERVKRQLTIAAVFHDINLAIRYCDQLLILDDGRLVGDRNPVSLLADDLLERVYHIQFARIVVPGENQTLIQARLP